jgi:hypothetical protein
MDLFLVFTLATTNLGQFKGILFSSHREVVKKKFKMKIKIKSIGADIEFLKKCLKFGVTPKFMHIT